MIPVENTTTIPEIIGAVGGVLTSLVTLYLVHRRVLADRDTKWHREEERVIHDAVVKKLGLEITRLKKDAKRRP